MQRPTGSTIFVIVFAVGWSAITGLADMIIAGKLLHSLLAATYPTVQGRVESARLIEMPSEGQPQYSPEIRYQYTVGGNSYSSGRIRSDSMAMSRASAERDLANYPLGASIMVHYAPWQPASAMIETAPSGILLAMVVFLAPFNVILVGICAAAVSVRRRARDRPPAGGLLVVESPGLVRLRVHTIYPAVAGFIGAGAAAFLLIWVLAAGFDLEPPRWASVVAILIIPLAGFGVGRCARRMRPSREAFIEIDESKGELRIPKCRHLRWHAATLQLRTIQWVHAETRVEHDEKQTTLVFGLADRQRMTLPTQVGWEDTRAIAAFLYEHIRRAQQGRNAAHPDQAGEA